MCLYIKDSDEKVSKEPIKCYKYLRRSHGEYSTPYQGTIVADKVVVKSLLPEEKILGKYVVSSGYIHTFEHDRDAKIEAFPYYGTYRVFECEIPAGTPYYYGITEYGYNSYASECIVIKKPIV